MEQGQFKACRTATASGARARPTRAAYQDRQAAELGVEFWRKEAAYYRDAYNDLHKQLQQTLRQTKLEWRECEQCGPRPAAFFAVYREKGGEAFVRKVCRWCLRQREKERRKTLVRREVRREARQDARRAGKVTKPRRLTASGRARPAPAAAPHSPPRPAAATAGSPSPQSPDAPAKNESQWAKE